MAVIYRPGLFFPVRRAVSGCASRHNRRMPVRDVDAKAAELRWAAHPQFLAELHSARSTELFSVHEFGLAQRPAPDAVPGSPGVAGQSASLAVAELDAQVPEPARYGRLLFLPEAPGLAGESLPRLSLR